MAWGDVAFDARERLLALYEAKDMRRLKQEAEQLGLSRSGLCRRLREHRLYKQTYAVEVSVSAPFFTRTFDDYPVLEWESAIITSDYEEPYADPVMKDLVLRMGVKHNVQRLVINGDFIAADQPGISSHAQIRQEEEQVSFRQALEYGRADLVSYHRWFTDIVGTTGNHDDMVNRATDGAIDLGMLIQGVPGYRYTEYAYCVIQTVCGPYLVCHPRQYRNHALALARAIYSVFATQSGEKAHIVIGHTHHTESGKSPDNLRGCHSLGCMRDPLKAQYKNLNITTYHQWNRGFGMILNGYFHNFDLETTDWEFWLGDLCPEMLQHDPR